MDKIKVAIIGCGTIANAAHMPGYKAASDLCEVKYFCDLIPERAESLRDRNGKSGTKAEAQTDHQEVYRTGGADGSQTLRPEVTADDSRIHKAVELLEQDAEQQGKRKRNNLFQRAAFCQVARHHPGHTSKTSFRSLFQLPGELYHFSTGKTSGIIQPLFRTEKPFSGNKKEGVRTDAPFRERTVIQCRWFSFQEPAALPSSGWPGSGRRFRTSP